MRWKTQHDERLKGNGNRDMFEEPYKSALRREHRKHFSLWIVYVVQYDALYPF